MKTYKLFIRGDSYEGYPDHEDTLQAQSHEEAVTIFTSRLNKNNPDSWKYQDVEGHVEEV